MCTYTTDSLLQYICAVNGIAVIYLNSCLQWSCQDTLYTVLSGGHTGCSDSWRIDRNCYTCLRTTQPGKLHTGHIECISSTYSLELEIITLTWLVLRYIIFGYRLLLLLLLVLLLLLLLNPDGLKKNKKQKNAFSFALLFQQKDTDFPEQSGWCAQKNDSLYSWSHVLVLLGRSIADPMGLSTLGPVDHIGKSRRGDHYFVLV